LSTISTNFEPINTNIAFFVLIFCGLCGFTPNFIGQ
jgi:hypothetical protein